MSKSDQADQYRMDGHKLYWHLDRVLDWQQGKRIAPLHVDMGISTGCNFSCRYCYGMLQGRKGEKNTYNMPEKAIVNFFTDAKNVGVRSIALIGEGENTLNPALYSVIEHAKSIALDISLATNGLKLKREGLEKALSGLSWIRFNISAAAQDVYSYIHGVDAHDYEQVLANIAHCVAIKRKNNLGVAIGLQAVLLQKNLNQIVPLAQLGRELGVDYLVIKPCSDTYTGTLKAPLEEYMDLEEAFLAAEACSTPGYNVIIKRLKLQNKGIKPYHVCHGTEFIIAVSGNGNVLPCGHWFTYESGKYLMGNVIEERFSKIVASDRYAAVQAMIKQVDPNRDCEGNCRQHYVNMFLDMLAQKPNHINFI